MQSEKEDLKMQIERHSAEAQRSNDEVRAMKETCNALEGELRAASDAARAAAADAEQRRAHHQQALAAKTQECTSLNESLLEEQRKHENVAQVNSQYTFMYLSLSLHFKSIRPF